MHTVLQADGWITVGAATARGRAFVDGKLLDPKAIAARFDEVVAADTTSQASKTVDSDWVPFCKTHTLSTLDRVAITAEMLDGFFAAVVTSGDAMYVVADGARSIPLYYASDGPIVSDRGQIVADTVESEVDPVAESEFLLTRYVTGGETIWTEVGSTVPGEVHRVSSNGVCRRRYQPHWPGGDVAVARSESNGTRRANEKVLQAGFETALDRLQQVADGRPVVIPLSGGFDSRLIAAGLVQRGHEVIGFTFGRSGHPDVEVSREVADRLDIQWEFVPYTQHDWAEWYHGNAGDEYCRRAFSGDALPFLAEWPAVHQLKTSGRVPADALFCPGHTVATPGERLPQFSANGTEMAGSSDESGDTIEPTIAALVEYIVETHYSLWEWDSEAFRSAITKRVRRGLLGNRSSNAIANAEMAAAAYERWEVMGRMATFTNGDLRVYEDAGLDWWLPLWDPAYAAAWQQLPAETRRGKSSHTALATTYYEQAADVSTKRATVTDRSLSPSDRMCALLRHTPIRQFTERDGEWDPPFLTRRSAWNKPGQHPLAWYGILPPTVRENIDQERSLYALRTLAATGRLDFSDPGATAPDGRLSLSVDN